MSLYLSDLPSLNTKPSLKMYLQGAGKGKTASIVTATVSAMMKKRPVLIVQPGTIQLNETRERIVSLIEEIYPDQLEELASRVRVLSSDGESYNQERPVRMFLDEYGTEHSCDLVLLITQNMFLRYIFEGASWAKFDLHLDEALPVVSTTVINATASADMLAPIIRSFVERKYSNKYSYIEQNPESTSLLIKILTYDGGDLVFRKFKPLVEATLNRHAVSFIQEGVLESLKDALAPDFEEVMIKMFDQEKDINKIFDDMVEYLHLTEKMQMKLGKIIEKSMEEAVTVGASLKTYLRKALVNAILEDKMLEVFTVLSPTILTAFKSVAIYGANLFFTEMAVHWKLFTMDKKDFDIVSNDDEIESPIDFSIHNYFNVSIEEPFVKHSGKNVTFWVPQEQSMSRKKLQDNDHIYNSMALKLRSMLGEDEEFVMLGNSWFTKIVSAQEKELLKVPGAKHLTHNMHGQNDSRHITKSMMMSQLNPQPTLSNFYHSVLGVTPEFFKLLRHLDITYQFIFRTIIRIDGNEVPSDHFIINKNIANKIAKFYFEKVLILEIPDTYAQPGTVIYTQDIVDQINNMKSLHPELKAFSPQQIFQSKCKLMVRGKEQVMSSTDEFDKFNKNGTGGDIGMLLKIINKSIEIKSKDKSNASQADRNKANMIRKNNPEYVDLTVNEMKDMKIFDDYSARGISKTKPPVVEIKEAVKYESDPVKRAIYQVRKMWG